MGYNTWSSPLHDTFGDAMDYVKALTEKPRDRVFGITFNENERIP